MAASPTLPQDVLAPQDVPASQEAPQMRRIGFMGLPRELRDEIYKYLPYQHFQHCMALRKPAHPFPPMSRVSTIVPREMIETLARDGLYLDFIFNQKLIVAVSSPSTDPWWSENAVLNGMFGNKGAGFLRIYLAYPDATVLPTFPYRVSLTTRRVDLAEMGLPLFKLEISAPAGRKNIQDLELVVRCSGKLHGLQLGIIRAWVDTVLLESSASLPKRGPVNGRDLLEMVYHIQQTGGNEWRLKNDSIDEAYKTIYASGKVFPSDL